MLCSGNDLDQALALYEKNTRLAEAFYTPLQCLEVCLRNAIHRCMSNGYATDWFHDNSVPLSNESILHIQDAENALRHEPLPLRPGSIVAELKFGFWVGMLGPGYDATIWRKHLYKAFLARSGKKRGDVHSRLNALRRFRNRVAHHEPIYHRQLTVVHDEIIESIGWMCRDTARWATHHSRVPAVIAAG